MIQPMIRRLQRFLVQLISVFKSTLQLSQQRFKLAPVVIFTVVLLWSGGLGWGLAHAQLDSIARPNIQQFAQPVDPIPEQYQLGAEIYAQQCGSCHVALPPQVLSTQAWRDIITSSQHYGLQIQLPDSLRQQAMWEYLQTFSRLYEDNEPLTYRVARSRFFEALHPDVEFEAPVQIGSCASCHQIVSSSKSAR